MAIYSTEIFTTSAKNFVQQLLQWANTHNSCCFLSSNGYLQNYHQADIIVAVQATDFCVATNHVQLHQFLQQHSNKYVFGSLNYEYHTKLANADNEANTATTADTFPSSYFFVPAIVITIKNSQVCIYSMHQQPATIFATINNWVVEEFASPVQQQITIQQGVSKQQYLQHVNSIVAEIKRGNCYELNYCIPFTATAQVHPLWLYNQLNAVSPNPFAAFYKVNNNYVVCASPERYVQKQDTTIISQPIKGTSKRNITNAAADEQLKQLFYHNPKERSENVMVVDLVRNDFTKICLDGTVQVRELFGVYTFPQVHQMISTIEGKVEKELSFATVVQHTFPMGSMTGAPKKKVMELIEKFETIPRGIYSGTIGYITPNNNFDFNVVIRSIVYNSVSQHLQYHVGSGITANSIAEQEYEECLLKASAMQQIIENRHQ